MFHLLYLRKIPANLSGLQKLKFNDLEWPLKKHSQSVHCCIQNGSSKSKPSFLFWFLFSYLRFKSVRPSKFQQKKAPGSKILETEDTASVVDTIYGR